MDGIYVDEIENKNVDNNNHQFVFIYNKKTRRKKQQA